MGRSLEFEPSDAVEKAMMVFWRKGYQSTSIPDLEEATGVGRKSLYRTFHDKHKLFIRALESYRRLISEENLSPLMRADAGLDEVRGLLRGLASLGGTPQGAMGCLICNTAMERAEDDPEVAHRVDIYFGQIRKAFANALEGAAGKGEIPDDTDISREANFLLGVVLSLCVLGRSGADAKTMSDVVESALARFS